MATPNRYTFDLRESLSGPISQKVHQWNTATCTKAPAGEILKEEQLRSRARADARTWKVTTGKYRLTEINRRHERADRVIRKSLRRLKGNLLKGRQAPDEANLLLENSSLLCAVLQEVRRALRSSRELPQAETPKSGKTPRAYVAIQSYLLATKFDGDSATISTYLAGAQE